MSIWLWAQINKYMALDVKRGAFLALFVSLSLSNFHMESIIQNWWAWCFYLVVLYKAFSTIWYSIVRSNGFDSTRFAVQIHGIKTLCSILHRIQSRNYYLVKAVNKTNEIFLFISSDTANRSAIKSLTYAIWLKHRPCALVCIALRRHYSVCVEIAQVKHWRNGSTVFMVIQRQQKLHIC